MDVGKKLYYLKSSCWETFTWADIARNGKDCLIWTPKSRSNNRELTPTGSQPNSTIEIRNPSLATGFQCKPESPAEIPALQLVEKQTGESSQAAVYNSYDLFGTIRVEPVVAANYEYLTSVAQQYTVLNDNVKRDMKRILEKVNDIVACLYQGLDLSTLPYPQFDVIELRCPTTPTLVHKAMGLSEKFPGSLSNKLAMLGVRGQISLADLLHSMIGTAIYTWVFLSSFPTSLTRPDKSLGFLEGILDDKGDPQLPSTPILAMH